MNLHRTRRAQLTAVVALSAAALLLAGFPLHFKWQSCREAAGAVKYIVCNADEGDPGAYIDKYLMEQRPHSVLLGMMVAGSVMLLMLCRGRRARRS